MGLAMRQRLLTLGAVLVSAVLLAGCSAAPVDNSGTAFPVTTPPPGTPFPELPTLSYFTVAKTPVIDGAAAPTGEVAQPRSSKITVFDAVDGKTIAFLPSAESVPVVGHAPGWVRVMLPSRRVLPSQAKRTGGVAVPSGSLKESVNQGTGWIQQPDVTLTSDLPTVVVSRAAGAVYVVNHAGLRIASYPATIGGGVPYGPTYISPGSGVAAGCGDAPPVQLSAQSETSDSFRGQNVSPIFIGGPSPQCTYTAEEIAENAPRMIQLTPADALDLAKLLRPGLLVDVIGKPKPVVIS
jgi:hypothetical protein